MDVKRARLYFLLSLGLAVVSLCLTFFLSLTLFMQSHRDGNGSGLYVLSQFFSAPRISKELTIAAPFDKGDYYYDNDKNRQDVEQMLARYYLEMRYSYIPDKQEMIYRWGPRSPLMRLSTADVHRKITGGKQVEDFLAKMPKNEVKTIGITSFKKTSGRRQFDVNMDIYTLSENGQYKKESWRILMNFKYANSRKRFDKDFTNPYGLYFYSISETKNNY